MSLCECINLIHCHSGTYVVCTQFHFQSKFWHPLLRVKEIAMEVLLYLKTLFANDGYLSNDVSDVTKVLKHFGEIPAAKKETSSKIDYIWRPMSLQKDTTVYSTAILG